MKKPDYEKFFRDYVAVFDNATTGKVDVDRIRASYAEYFVSASAGGVVGGGANDAKYAKVLNEGAGFYRAIGLQGMNLLKVESTPIDAGHDMVRPFFRADYRKEDGSQVSIEFDVTYMLQRRAGGPKIFAFVAGDEMALYRKYGLAGQGRQADLKDVSLYSRARLAAWPSRPRRRGAASPAMPSSLTVLRGGSFTAAESFGNGSILLGIAIA